MATQKPGEWANTLISRFEEQVRVVYLLFYESMFLENLHLLINILIVLSLILLKT